MSTFFAVIKNNLFRLMAQKSRIFLYCALSIGAIIAALFFQNHSEKLGTVAIVSEQTTLKNSPFIDVVLLTEKPPLSDLVLGKYDAFVSLNQNNQYEIETIKGEEFKQKLIDILDNPLADFSDNIAPRKIGTNIIGFLMMFILIQGSSMMFLFAQDKEQGQLYRIATAPIPFFSYLLVQVCFVFLFLFIPPVLVFSLISFFIPITLGFSAIIFVGLIALICLLATTFALFINTIVQSGDSANMLTSAFVVITSILAGCFYPFEPNNVIAKKCIDFLPQKIILNLSTQLEQHTFSTNQYPYLIALTVFLFCLFILANHNTKKQLTN